METQEQPHRDCQRGKIREQFPPWGGEIGQPGEAEAGGGQDGGWDRKVGKFSKDGTDHAERFSRHGAYGVACKMKIKEMALQVQYTFQPASVNRIQDIIPNVFPEFAENISELFNNVSRGVFYADHWK
jgi:hypothetical protein